MSEQVGQQIGNYVITAPIGAGGMGAVYLAEHPEIGRRVAVKLLPAHLGLQPGFADRFRAEARAVALIEHPNVIEIYDYGQTEAGQLYYTMELLRGRELREVMDEGGAMPADQVLGYLVQICAALQAAHDCGVVHRDLKPENIFVLHRQPPQVKLLDFGLAKLTAADPGSSQTATGLIMGTPLTIAPEQSLELYQMVKQYQPNCLINSRIGNGACDYTSLCDTEIPEEHMAGGLYETPATLNQTWGYKSFDQNWKSSQEVMRLKNHLNSRGVNYLLNVGPDYLGRIPAPSVDILRDVGRALNESAAE